MVSLVAQMVKNSSAMQETQFDPCVGKIPWRRKWQPTPVFLPVEFHGQETGRLQSMRSQESDTTEQLHTHTHLASKDKIILISGPADDLP